MREIVSLQIGQCGNYIGREFWAAMLSEHGLLNDASSTFFKPGIGDAGPRARALLIDMEEGVLNSIKQSELSRLFGKAQYIAGTDGSGNNFAEGFFRHGDEQRERVEEALRAQAEQCDSLQGFQTFSSLGGGTGSGLGARVVQIAREAFPKAEIIALTVALGADSDVIVAPYNQTLSLGHLLENANLVLPFRNDLLYKRAGERAQRGQGQRPAGRRDFSSENKMIAFASSLLTTSMRFGGEMNMDLNEISQNLAPFYQANIVACALAPGGSTLASAVRSLSEDAAQLTGAFYRESLAVACVTRWNAAGTRDGGTGEALSGLQQLMKRIELPQWATHGAKLSVCDAGTLRPGACGLFNSAAGAECAAGAFEQYYRLRAKKLWLFHYLKFMEEADIDARAEIVRSTIDFYHRIGERMQISDAQAYTVEEWNRVLTW